MKTFLFLLFVITVNAFAVDTARFDILPGKFHSGGFLKSTMIAVSEDQQSMNVKLEYEVIRRPLVPVPSEYLKGEDTQKLPLEFSDERGYLNLEIAGTMELPDAYLKHMGRTRLRGLSDVHHVQIIAKNGRSEMEVFFHPTIPELGWLHLRLILHTEIPFLKNYLMEARLRD